LLISFAVELWPVSFNGRIDVLKFGITVTNLGLLSSTRPPIYK